MKHLLFALIGVLQGILSIWLLNRLPDSWFTEVDEDPIAAVATYPRWSEHLWSILSGLVLGGAAWFGSYTGGSTLTLLITMLLLQTLWMIALSDAKFQIIPDQFSLLLGGIGVLTWLSQPLGLLTSVLPALVITAGLPWLVGALWSYWRKQEALGMGDIKLLIAFSMIFGWPKAGFVLFTGIMLAGFYFAVLLLLRKLQLTDHSPLGPFLSLAAALWLLGESQFMQVVEWYLSLF